VDVGAVYDESKQRFDHHQRGFEEVFGHGFTTKLSSAGLVYKLACSRPCRPSSVDDPFIRHFGREVISKQLQLSLDDPKVESLWLKLYRVLFLLSFPEGVPCSPDFRNSSKHSMGSIMAFRSTPTTFSLSIGTARIFLVAWAGSIQHGMNLSIRKP
jgi:hypothetical protein